MNKNIKVQDYIKSLLFEYSPVIVPGLGAFTTRYKPAQLNEALGRISPPIKALEFNPQVTVNDGLLVSHIARQLKISESVAELEVKWFVNSLFAVVERDGRTTISGLGEFVADKNGRLIFNPIENLNYSTDTYGLEPIALNDDITTAPAAGIGLSGTVEKREIATTDELHSAKLEADSHKTEEKPSTFADVLLAPPPIVKKEEQTGDGNTLFERLSNSNSGSIATGASLGSILAANNSEEEAKEDEKKRKKGGLGIWAWLLPILMLGLFLLLISQLSSNKPWRERKPFSYIFGTSNKENEVLGDNTARQPVVDNTQPEPENLADSAGQAQPQDTVSTTTGTMPSTGQAMSEEVVLGPNQKMIDGLRVTESQAGEYANANQTKAGYYIVVGSWKNKAKAQEVAAQYNGYGYKTHLLETMTGNIRIGIYGPQDIPTIKQEYALIREKYDPNAWVMRFN